MTEVTGGEIGGRVKQEKDVTGGEKPSQTEGPEGGMVTRNGGRDDSEPLNVLYYTTNVNADEGWQGWGGLHVCNFTIIK